MHSLNPVPFLVPYWGKEELSKFFTLLLQGRLVQGDSEISLRQDLASYWGNHSVIFTNLGRTALQLALASWNIGPGDEVLLPSFLCGSVARAVLAVGAKPVWVDSGEDLTMDPESLEANISERSKVVVIVHAGGKVARMERLLAIAQRHKLLVVDDAAQALGASWNGRPCGTLGDAGIYSFGLGKNLMATQGGALLLKPGTDVEPLREFLEPAPHAFSVASRFLERWCFYRLRPWTMPLVLLKHYANSLRPVQKTLSEKPGPMANLDAALLRLQWEKQAQIISKRQAHAKLLKDLLKDLEMLRFPDDTNHVFTKCWVVLEDDQPSAPGAWGIQTQELARHLSRQGIEVEWPYVPLHKRPDIPGLTRGPLSKTESLWWRILALPVHPLLEEKDLVRAAGAVKNFFEEKARARRLLNRAA